MKKTIKYATYEDEEIKKYLINDENVSEKILIDNINELESTIAIFIDKYSDIIKKNKFGINEYMEQFKMVGLKYIIDSNITKIILEEIKYKLNKENTGNFNQYNLNDI